MVVDSRDSDAVDRAMGALADATRRDILRRVLRTEYCVSALAQSYTMSFAAVQKHVAVLERAQLVTKRRHGRQQLVRGNIAAVRRAARLLDQFEAVWRGRINQMADILAEPAQGD